MVCCTLACLAFFAFVLLAIFVFILRRSDADLTLLFWEKYGRPVDHLKKKVVWIVGASSGIGKSLALKLAAAGSRVVISARRVEELQKVKDECIKSASIPEDDILILPLDVTDYSKHEESLKQIIQKFGKLDIIVLNAGKLQTGIWEDTDIGVDKELFEVNVFSPVALANHVVNYFVENGGGHIVVTSSTAGKLASFPYAKSYLATKHALHGYFEALRIEHHENNIKVTMVCPGPVKSGILDSVLTDKKGEESSVKGRYKNDIQMDSERCAELIGAAIANELDEVWITRPPALYAFYASQYMPTIFRRLFSKYAVPLYKKMVKPESLPLKKSK